MKEKKDIRRVIGSKDRPRLAVYRSLNNIYAQVIDDEAGKTLAQASSLDPELKKKLSKAKKTDASKIIGEEVAKRAVAAGIKKVVFDRRNFLYHGRIKALADAARSAGLEF